MQSTSRRAADAEIICALLLLGVALPIALALWSHVFDIARNDDWAYRRVLWHFVKTGRFAFVGWGTMTLVGQILWGAAFAGVLGAHAWVPGVAVACASVIGLVAAYLVARSLLPSVWAGVCVLITLAFPGFLLNTSSFMTDIPGFSADMACLALGVGALRSRGRACWVLLVSSMAVGCFSFSIREFGLAAPVAVLVAMVGQDRRRWRAYAATGLCMLAICGAIYLWASNVPGAEPSVVAVPDYSSLRSSVEQLGGLFFTLSLVLSPLLPLVVWRLRRLSSWPGLALAVLALGVGVWLFGKSAVFLGNYLSQQGATGAAVLNGGRPDLFPEPVWRGLEVVAVAAGVVLALVVGAVGRDVARAVMQGTPEGLVAAFAALNVAILTVYRLFVRTSLFDRYAWPLAFAGAVVLVAKSLHAPTTAFPGAQERHRGRSALAWLTGAAVTGLGAVIILITAAITMNANAYDGARWRAGQLAVKAGVHTSQVDAGFEWVGFHANQASMSTRHLDAAPPYLSWYAQMFPGLQVCAFVSGSPSTGAGLKLLRTTTYNLLGVAVPEHLYIYRVESPGCGGGRAGSSV